MAKQRRHKPRKSASEILQATTAGADDALGTLINQFADPYSFLRELIQNSLDAASTQIDVSFDFEAEAKSDSVGMATITVADNGEGMNGQVIDEHLLTLFSSTKENDLTKIGKFGIGFVSIFAIEPELVVLETGQAGEAWRLIFFSDARYEKLRLSDDEPVEGTVVKLHKRVDAEGFEELKQRGRETVRYWCKFAEAVVMVDGESIREPFGLGDAALTVSYEEPGTELVVGFPSVDNGVMENAKVGFYNRGLTLVERPSSPGSEPELQGLSFRIKSRYLEHTLTRDNVLQDESYEKAIALLSAQVRGPLQERLRVHLQALALSHSGGVEADHDPGAPDLDAAWRYSCLPGMRIDDKLPILPTVDGKPLSIKQAAHQSSPVGALLVAERSNPLTRALAADGVEVLLDEPAMLSVLRNKYELKVEVAAELLYTAEPIKQSDLQRRFVAAVHAMLRELDVPVKGLHLGQLDYPDASVACAGAPYIWQREAFGVSQIGERPRLLGGARQLVLNVSHRLLQRCLALATTDWQVAALICAEAIGAWEACDGRDGARLAAKVARGDFVQEASDG